MVNYNKILQIPDKVRTDDSAAPLPALRAAAVLQVLGQGDADHEVQPEQARAGLRRLLRPPHPRRGRGREPILILHFHFTR